MNTTPSNLPSLDSLFPFEYQGGGYFREKGIAIGKSAEILHGQEAVKYLYDKIQYLQKETT